MGTLLSSFQRIVGSKLFTHDVRMNKNLEVDGDIIYKGSCAKPQVVTKSPPGVNLGPLILIPEGSRGSAWQLSGGASTSWVDWLGAGVANPYTPNGVKGLLLTVICTMTATSAGNSYLNVYGRKNGSAQAASEALRLGYVNINPSINGTLYGTSATEISVLCDANGIFEYIVTLGAATGLVYMLTKGYYMGG